MLHYFLTKPNSAPYCFNTRLLEDTGSGMVYAPGGMLTDSFYIRYVDRPSRLTPIVSIVICTYGREDSLNETLSSLTGQTFKDFEVVLVTKKGDLSVLRDQGLRSAAGDIVSFIDDDVYCPSTWLEGVVKNFREGVLGVTGPTIITEEYRGNRDSIAFQGVAGGLLRFFGVSDKPGHLSPAGAPSMASNNEGCRYEGPVEYLECCNMSVRKREAIDVGGFDKIYTGTGEWSEPDLSLKIGKAGRLWFSPDALLYHRPSRQGIYKARLSTAHRWHNFMVFQRRHVRGGLKTYLYRAFVWSYFFLKGLPAWTSFLQEIQSRGPHTS